MNRLMRSALGLIVLLLLHSSALSQGRMVISGDAFRIPELSVMLSEEDKAVTVLFAMPKDSRIKPYRTVDIQRGDVVLYLNGKRIKALSEFEEQYKALAIGDAVQIGLRRGEERFISSFDKADPEDLPQMGMSRTVSGDGAGDESGGSQRMMLGPEAEGATPVLGLGALLKDIDKKVQVVAKLPTMGEGSSGPSLQEGDVIAKLDGVEMKSVSQLAESFDAIEPGADVSLVVLRGGKVIKARFAKPKVQGNVIMRTQMNDD